LDARSRKSSPDILVRAALHQFTGLVEPIAGDAPAHGPSVRRLAVRCRQRSPRNLAAKCAAGVLPEQLG